MYCWRCGVERPDTGACPQCSAPLQPPSDDQLTLQDLIGPGETSNQAVHVSKVEYVVSGESLKDLPQDLPAEARRIIEDMKTQGATGRREIYRVKDSSGVDQTYASLDEMPPEIRAHFERIRSEVLPPSGVPRTFTWSFRTGTGTGIRDFWFMGAIVAPLMIGLGIAAMINMKAVIGFTGRSVSVPRRSVEFLFKDGATWWFGIAVVVLGLVLHAVMFWGAHPQGRKLRTGLTVFFCVLIAGLTVGSFWTLLETLQRDLTW